MPAAAPTWIERRAWPRRRNPLRVVILDPDDALDRPYRGWVVDRSRGGLRLMAKQEFAAGSLLKVRPIGAPPRARWIEVQVKHCRAKDKSWELGCRFLSRPSVVTMLLFG